jgi:hypothetical protein
MAPARHHHTAGTITVTLGKDPAIEAGGNVGSRSGGRNPDASPDPDPRI